MSTGERVTAKTLDSKNLYYEYALIPKFLHGLHLDFYVSSLKLGIEYDGGYHFRVVGYGDNDSLINRYIKRRTYDKKKNIRCKRHGINLLRIEDYRREAYKPSDMVKLLNSGLHEAKLLFNNSITGRIIYSPQKFTYLHVNISMIKDARPLTTLQEYKDVFLYLKNHTKYGQLNYALAETLVILFMHTKDILRIKYNDICFHGIIKRKFRDSNNTICNVRIWNVNPQLCQRLQKYVNYLNDNRIHSQWLFPDPNNYNKHLSLKEYSKILSNTADHFNLKHFNIYSLRKTGGYLVYKQLGLKSANFVLSQSDIFSTAKYLGLSESKLMKKYADLVNFKNLGI